jgi:two-component system response regulator PilR (NtrC family)
MPENILVVDDEPMLRETLTKVLSEEGYTVSMAADSHEALGLIENAYFDLVLCDIVMPGMDGMELLGKIRKSSLSITVIIMTAYGTVESAVEAMKNGAFDYILKPIIFDDLILKLKKIFNEKRLYRSNMALVGEIKKRGRFSNIIGASSAIQSVLDLIDKVAPTESNVLITGKTGTGKELVARAIHEKSLRGNELFLPVNCPAIPVELMESEMFGHMKGAFTGATENKEGLFKIADRGTIFLDEICSISFQVQSKLLRIIETKEVFPLGGKKYEKIDVRILAATNKDLKEEVLNNRFREDLYYRLNVFNISLPTLAERKEDIPLLIEHIIKKYNDQFQKNVEGLESAVLNKLLNYEWKGNIRELENMMERAMIMCEEKFITGKDLTIDFSGKSAIADNNYLLKESVNIFEKEHIKTILQKTANDRKKAARFLGLSLSSLYRKIEELGIEGRSD